MNYQQPPPPIFYKNPGLAAVLSFFWMGLGQVYNGQIAKGVIFIAAYAISWVLWAVGIGVILTPILWIYGIWDAYKSAQKKNIELQEMYAQSSGAQAPPPPQPDPTLREHPKPAPPPEPEPPVEPAPPVEPEPPPEPKPPGNESDSTGQK